MRCFPSRIIVGRNPDASGLVSIEDTMALTYGPFARDAMLSRRVSFFTLFFVFFGSVSHAQTYDDEMSLGIGAYQNGLIAQAAEHFRKAIEVDADAISSRMYLATVYAGEYIPGVDTPENRWVADKAIELYRFVINSNADHTQKINAAKGMAYIYLNLREYEDAKENYMLASDLDPKDPNRTSRSGFWTGRSPTVLALVPARDCKCHQMNN
jgi:tetratricopeptide (TPR) repeat protein